MGKVISPHSRRSHTALLLVAVGSFVLLDVQSIRIGGGDGRRLVQPVVVASLLALLTLRLYASQRVSRSASLSSIYLTFVAYALWCMASAMWALSPQDSVTHAAVLLLSGLVAVMLARESRLTATRVYVIVAVVVAVLGWGLAATGHPAALTSDAFWRLQGIMTHAQRLALLVGAALIALVVVRPAWRKVHPLLWASAGTICLVTLAASGARAFSAWALLLVVAHLARANIMMRLTVVTGAVGFGVGLGLLFMSGIPLEEELVLRGSEATLTGRVGLWGATLQMISEHPWLGVGFGNYRLAIEGRMLGWFPWHAHNMWLHSVAETGLIGAGLLLLFFLSVVRTGLRFSRMTGQSSISLFIAGYTFLAGLTGVAVGEKMGPLYGLLLLLSLQEQTECMRSSDPVSEEHDSRAALEGGGVPESA